MTELRLYTTYSRFITLKAGGIVITERGKTSNHVPAAYLPAFRELQRSTQEELGFDSRGRAFNGNA